MIEEIAKEIAKNIAEHYDKHFKLAISNIEQGQDLETSYKKTPILVVNGIATLTLHAHTFRKYVKSVFKTHKKKFNRTVMDKKLFYEMDKYFNAKYQIISESSYEPSDSQYVIKFTKARRTIGDIDMVMVLTLKNKETDKSTLVLTNADEIKMSEIVAIKNLVEMRKTDWPDVSDTDVIATVERELLDKGVKLIAYDNYIIEY